MSTTRLSLLHFNDVYHMSARTFLDENEQKITIDVTHFAKSLDTLNRKITESSGEKPLLLFSGDLFSPSAESMLAQGGNMVKVMDKLGPDACLIGNHEFDHGFPQFEKLVKESKSAWIASNIIDEKTGLPAMGLTEYLTFKRGDIKIGVIGIFGRELPGTIRKWPNHYKVLSEVETCKKLSEKLRHPDFEEGHPCDIIIALTHSLLKNDIELAKTTLAYPATPERRERMAKEHGVDILLGGHDHDYYVGKGVVMDGECNMARVANGEWPDYKPEHTREDEGLLIVKSGYDFRDLSEVVLELEATPDGSARRKLVKSAKVVRHATRPEPGSLADMTTVLDECRKNFDKYLHEPFCLVQGELNFEESLVRKRESAVGNWLADIFIHAFDDTPILRERGKGPDGAIISGGSIRGNSILYQDKLTPNDIMEIFPYEQTTVVALDLTGAAIHEALEGAFDNATSGGGGFPVISGLRVEWNSTEPKGRRVKKISVKDVEIGRESGERYLIVTNSFLAEGKDGYTSFKDKENLFPDGMSMYNMVYVHLLTGQFLHVTKRALDEIATADDMEENLKKLEQALKALGPPGSNPKISDAQLAEYSRILQEVQGQEAARVEPEGDIYLPLVAIPAVDGRLRDISLGA